MPCQPEVGLHARHLLNRPQFHVSADVERELACPSARGLEWPGMHSDAKAISYQLTKRRLKEVSHRPDALNHLEP